VQKFNRVDAKRREMSEPLHANMRAMDINMKGKFRKQKGKNKCPKNQAHTSKSHRVVRAEKERRESRFGKNQVPEKKCRKKMPKMPGKKCVPSSPMELLRRKRETREPLWDSMRAMCPAPKSPGTYIYIYIYIYVYTQ